MASRRTLNRALPTGRLGARAARYTTGLHRKSAEGFVPVADAEVIGAALSVLSAQVSRGNTLNSPRAVREFLAIRYANLEHEVFTCIFLDNRHRVIACEDLFRGTIDGASVYPREVVKAALAHNAAACLLAHPHPSGIAEPSQADEFITRRLKEALALVDIRLIDHVVIGGGAFVSLAERGVI
jgi:DNA repair protein RadC